MFGRHGGSRRAAVMGTLALAVGLAGCAKVSRKDYDSDMARLREEVANGDKALGSRVDSSNARIVANEQRIAAFEQRLDSLRTKYDVSIEKMRGALKFNVPVHFDFNSADLRDTDRTVLAQFASVVKEYYPEAVITVEGFTDPAGSQAYNMRLGEHRAEAVRDYLSTTGSLPSDQLRTVSYGESPNRQVEPGAQGPGEKGLPNRRVALVIDYTASAAAAPSMSMQ